MSKPVKELVRKDLIARLQGVSSLAIVGFTGVDAVSNNRLRAKLMAKDIRITVVKNSIARQAFKEMGLEPAVGLLEGPCAVAYGADSVVTIVRELLEIKRDTPNLKVKGALLEGRAFGEAQIADLSKFPTRGEAIGRVVACVLSPGSKIAACLIGPGAKLASIIKTVEDKAKEAQQAQEAQQVQEAQQAAPPGGEAPAAA